VEPLKCAEVAAAASVSWQTGEACIYGTTSLVSHCLTKGENIAFVLKDIGVLLIDGTRVQMKYYRDFLERICGKEDLKIALSKVRFGFLHGLGSPTALALPACDAPASGQLLGQARATVLSALTALGFSSTLQCFSHDKDVPQPPCSSPAGPLVEGHGGFPGGGVGLPDVLRPGHRLSQVSMLVAVASP